MQFATGMLTAVEINLLYKYIDFEVGSLLILTAYEKHALAKHYAHIAKMTFSLC